MDLNLKMISRAAYWTWLFSFIYKANNEKNLLGVFREHQGYHLGVQGNEKRLKSAGDDFRCEAIMAYSENPNYYSKKGGKNEFFRKKELRN
jgi:hypothetical protein